MFAILLFAALPLIFSCAAVFSVFHLLILFVCSTFAQ